MNPEMTKEELKNLTDEELLARAAELAKQLDDENRVPGCTCECPSEWNDAADPDPWHDRHEEGCALLPDFESSSWLWYPHDGELEDGGVLVNPRDPRWIFLVVDGYCCPVPLGELDE